MFRRAASTALLVVASCVVSAAPSSAQAWSGADLGIGYSSLHDIDSGAAYDRGWIVALAGRRHGSLGWVAEASGDARTPAGVAQRLHALLGGPRLTARVRGPVAPFGQVLLGWERYDEPGFVENGVALQPGGGVDVRITARTAGRLQADWRAVRAAGDKAREIRVAASVVVALGG